MTLQRWITLGVITVLVLIVIAHESGPAAWAALAGTPQSTVPTKTPASGPTSQPPPPKEPTDTPRPTPGGETLTPTLPTVGTTYTIQAGDTLFEIAQKFNLTLDQLLALNPGLTRDSIIHIGEVLRIAGPIPTPTETSQPVASATAALTLTATAISTVTPTTAPTQTSVASTATGVPTAPITPLASPVVDASPTAQAATIPAAAAENSSSPWLLIIAAVLIIGGGFLVFRRRRSP